MNDDGLNSHVGVSSPGFSESSSAPNITPSNPAAFPPDFNNNIWSVPVNEWEFKSYDSWESKSSGVWCHHFADIWSQNSNGNWIIKRGENCWNWDDGIWTLINNPPFDNSYSQSQSQLISNDQSISSSSTALVQTQSGTQSQIDSNSNAQWSSNSDNTNTNTNSQLLNRLKRFRR